MKTTRLKKVAIALSTIALAGTITACGGGNSSPAADDAKDNSMKTLDVNFGYIPDLNGTALLAIADDQKLWDKYHLKVHEQTFTNGPLQITALGTKDLDYGYIGNGAFWLPARGEADIACLIGYSNADRVIAQPNIKSLADLKGKRVGVPEGTSGDTVLGLALEKAGLTVNDIQRIPMDPAAIASAFAAKQIDAAGIWYPIISTIKEHNPGLVELATNKDFSDKMAFPSAIVMRKNLAKENPELALRVEKVLAEALNFRQANPDKTLELIATKSNQPVDKLKDEAKYMGVLSATEQVKMWNDGTIAKWIDGVNKRFIAAGKLKEGQALKPADYFQYELLEKAADAVK